jgi:hypothetical protein
LAGRTGVRLDYVEDAPGGVVFDCQHLLALFVGLPVHVDGDAGIFLLEANPRPPATLFVRILGHVLMLLKTRVDAVGPDTDPVSGLENVADDLCTSAEALMQMEDAVFEIVGILW